MVFPTTNWSLRGKDVCEMERMRTISTQEEKRSKKIFVETDAKKTVSIRMNRSDLVIVVYCEIYFGILITIFSFYSLRMKEHPTERPERYEEILASPAIQSLPKEITDEEVKMVKNVIEQIPQVPDN